MRRLALAIVALAACGRSPDAGRSLATHDCEAAGVRAQCTTLAVPEDRDDPDSREIELAISIIPAFESPSLEPIVLLAGGPGQGAIEAFAPLLPRFNELRAQHDIVLLDQRGTGRSHPLSCGELDDLDLEQQLATDVDSERLTRCLDDLDADPRLYTTTHAIADLVAALDGLGYASANLVGGSYGTRMALAFARSHPDRVRSIVVDGVAPVDMAMPLSFASDSDRALAKLFDDCAAEPACKEAFPDSRAQLDEVLAHLGSEPRTVIVEHPRTGEAVEMELTRSMLAHGIRGSLYVPDLSALLPLAISRARVGEYSPLIAQTLLLRDGVARNMAEGMFLSVICSEDVPFITDAAIERDAEGTMLGREIVETMQESCALWRHADVPDGYRDPVAVDVPTLVLSGELDPVTPPRWGEHAAESLGRARHIVVPGAAHGTLGVPCMSGVLADFVASADPEALDASCVEEHVRPPFFIDFAGPSLAAR